MAAAERRAQPPDAVSSSSEQVPDTELARDLLHAHDPILDANAERENDREPDQPHGHLGEDGHRSNTTSQQHTTVRR
jgi:hypothetical protein